MSMKLKCGIEIHQRLDTGKLFCRCPSTLSEGEEPTLKIRRNLRASKSEIGEIDRAAFLEQEKRLNFQYEVFGDTCCLVEMDEEPPLPMNRDALMVVLGICTQLNMHIVDQVHTMRKIVVDGSNTSGFQRTALLATGGSIETSEGKVGIDTIAIEEESAGILDAKKEGGREASAQKHYRLDRLGIPLIELATSPDIKSPAHCREVAEKIGMILRATGKAARGLGTIRQDINVSIPEGARVEIKGVQDLKAIPAIVEIEVKRQEGLLKLLKKLEKTKSGETLKAADLTGIFAQTESGLIRRALASGHKAMGILLKSHKGLLGTELQPGKRYGTELADYAKTAGVKGIIHSDEDLSKYKISEKEAGAIAKELGARENDAFVLVAAEEGIARMALARVAHRAAMREIPGETRKANPDSTTSYMRPLPGKARMYPETDIPVLDITESLMRSSKESAGEGLAAKEKKLGSLLNAQMAKRMLKSRNLKTFEKLVGMGVEPMLAASTLEDTLVALRREGVDIKSVPIAMEELFSHYLKGEFAKSAIIEILPAMAEGKGVEEILDERQLHKISGKELEKLVKEHKGNLGEIMKNYRLRVDAGEAKALLAKKKKK
jgi:glutamyl-tRNA(Gln) amidotransferase subunit E